MWESGKREPNIDRLYMLAQCFSTSIDYILGYTNDPTPPEQRSITTLNGNWVEDETLHQMLLDYLQLDGYGKDATKSIITAEKQRCLEHNTLLGADGFLLTVRVAATGKDSDVNNGAQNTRTNKP